MSLEINFVPLTFIKNDDEILKQIRNTAIFSFLFENFEETTLNFYLEFTQYGYTASANTKGTHRLLRITDINNGTVNWDNVPYCDCDSEEKYLLQVEDILIARTGGTSGKSFIVVDVPKNSIFASYLIRLRLKKDVEIEFINLFLNSYTFWSQIIEMKSGSAIPNVNAEKLKILKIPLCDFETQKNIVSFLKYKNHQSEYIDLTNKIKKLEYTFNSGNSITAELTHQRDLVKKLKQQLLNDAVQGKLVPQNFNDEPASALLARIKTEKAQSGKKEKPLPPITKTEIPFEIPSNWVWCRLGEIGDLKRGKSKHRPRNDESLFENGIYPFIQTGDVSKAKFNQDLIITVNNYYNEFGLKQSEMQMKGTFCITIAANIAECGFLDFDACVPDSIVCFSALNKYFEKYAFYYLKIAKEELEKFAPATAQKNINLGILNDLRIPIPPLEEQKRIVEKLEHLMAQCNALETHITESAALNAQLLQQVLREALQSEK